MPDEVSREIQETSEEPPAIVVRPMRGSDIEAVAKIERQSFATAWSTQAYVTELANPSAVYFVAALDVSEGNSTGSKVVGYGGLWVIMDEAHITTIAVVPEFRGRRVGEQVLAEMLYTARQKGATRATLEVRESNLAARRLYEKYGFVRVAARKGYYADNNENADIMWINDMETPDWRHQFAQHRAALGLPTG